MSIRRLEAGSVSSRLGVSDGWIEGRSMARVSRAEIEASIRKRQIWADTIGRLGPKLTELFGKVAAWLSVAASVYFASGRDTTFLAVVEVGRSASVGLWLGWGLAVVTGAGWIMERQFRRRDVSRLSERVRTLEAQIDPSRTISGLTPLGENQPGDP